MTLTLEKALSLHPTVWDEDEAREMIQRDVERTLRKQAERARREGKRD